jgi:hypothetical protein
VWDTNAGDTGYASFGTTSVGTGLLQAITATPPTGAIFVTYLNIDDSNEAAAAGSTILSYNGITFSPVIGTASTLTPVEEGQYTFWSYEQVFYNNLTTNQLNFVNALVAEFPTYAEVPLSGLNVSRYGDGSPIYQNY